MEKHPDQGWLHLSALAPPGGCFNQHRPQVQTQGKINTLPAALQIHTQNTILHTNFLSTAILIAKNAATLLAK